MRKILQQRGMRFVFLANLVSMMGSGMNGAALNWSILQATHSEMSLSLLVVLQTIPAMALMPFSGVIIDREDRRHLVMWLDAIRGLIVLTVALLCLFHRSRMWELYGMNIIISIGFWLFWPTINALVQELSHEDELGGANSLLMAGVQGGWLLAGAFVGFVYNRIGLGGVLLIDFSTYVVSFLCYFGVRKGRQVVAPQESFAMPEHVAGDAMKKYFHEMKESFTFIRQRRAVMLMGAAWSLFLAAMLTQAVTTSPISDRLLHAGAVGYGWLNFGWAMGAFTSVAYAARTTEKMGARRAVTLCMSVLAVCSFFMGTSRWLALTVALYFLMGSGRGWGGIAITTDMMQRVPKHFMGRVQNTFYFLGTGLQIFTAVLVGWVAHHVGLARGIAIIGGLYAVAAVAAMVPTREGVRVEEEVAVSD
ncbi:MAG TPA: MFS transporter [Candidatus Koribacter sp.]|jgi:MFS family permease